MDHIATNQAAIDTPDALFFDGTQKPLPIHLILSLRSGKFIREIPIDNVRFHETLMSGSEISFSVYKEKCLDENGSVDEGFWRKIKDLKLAYCKELDRYYELRVNLQESDETVKTVTAVSLGEAEVSQCNVYGLEINTETDIARDDYRPTVLYDADNKDRSLVDRMFSKMSHYRIEYVDASIAGMQRTFQFDGKSVYDCCREIEEEIGCVFLFSCRRGPGNKVVRTVSVRDMMCTCDACGARGDFADICDNCGSTLIHRGYGKDTGVYISKENLAKNVEYIADVDSVKNCFRLSGGDDLMTAAIIAQNPNGSQYIWYVTDEMREDMTEELRARLDAYDEHYAYCQDEHPIEMDDDVSDLRMREMLDFYREHYSVQVQDGKEYDLRFWYNNIVDRYTDFNELLCKIMGDIVGYPAMMEAYYNTIELELFLESGLMPNTKNSSTSAAQEAEKLTAQNLSPAAVADLDACFNTTAANAVLNMAKCIVRKTYSIKVKSSFYDAVSHIWTGNFEIKNYSDEEDIAVSNMVQIEINNDIERYIRQKIALATYKEMEDAVDIIELFDSDENTFKSSLRKYCLKRLEGFRDSCQVSLDTMIQHGITDSNSEAYTTLYAPYRQKLIWIEHEIKARDTELAIVTALRDEDGRIISEGMQAVLERNIEKIHDEMNFERFVGDELMEEFASFRRDDDYNNPNYISDGLDNRELFRRAADFISTAKREIAKAARVHHTIRASLNDLLLMDAFKPITNDFRTGNKMKVRVDGKLFTLRLSEYEINYETFELSNVVFCDVVDGSNPAGDISDVLEKAKSISTTYNAVKRQASVGQKTSETLNDIAENGLRLTTHIVGGAHNQEFLLDESGYLGRTYIPETDSYSPEQIRIISNGIYITDDDWETMKAALGKFQYYNPKTQQVETGFGVIADKLVGGMLLTEEAGIYNENGSVVIDENGIKVVVDCENNMTAFTIMRRDKDGDETPVFTVDSDGNLVITGRVEATSGYIGSATNGFEVKPNAICNGMKSFEDTVHNGVYIGNNGIALGKGKFKVTNEGKVTASDLDITGGSIEIKNGSVTKFHVTNTGKVTASDLTINGGQINFNNGAFSVTPDGTVNASDLNITGGSIMLGNAGNNIPVLNITSEGEMTARSLDIKGGSIALGGDESNPVFNVSNDGAVTASDMTLTGGSISIKKSAAANAEQLFRVSNGTIYADFNGGTFKIGDKFQVTDGSATIGGFAIGDDGIYSNYQSVFYSDVQNENANGVGVHISSSGIRLGPNFRVDSQGNLFANNGTFAGYVYAKNIQYDVDQSGVENYGTLSGIAITQYSVTGDRIGYGQIEGGVNNGGQAIAQLSVGASNALGYANAYNSATDQAVYIGNLDNYPQYFSAGYLSVKNILSVREDDGCFIRTPKIKSKNYTFIRTLPTTGEQEVDFADHYHQLTEQTVNGESTGRVVLGKPYWSDTAPFFNIADTAFFRQQMSAITFSRISSHAGGYDATLASNIYNTDTDRWVALYNSLAGGTHVSDYTDGYLSGIIDIHFGSGDSIPVLVKMNASAAYNAGAASVPSPSYSITDGNVSADPNNPYDSSNPNVFYVKATFNVDGNSKSYTSWVNVNSVYSAGQTTGANGVSITSTSYSSYSTSADNEVELGYSYVRYDSSNDQIKGRISVTLSNGSTETIFVKMDASRVSSSPWTESDTTKWGEVASSMYVEVDGSDEDRYFYAHIYCKKGDMTDSFDCYIHDPEDYLSGGGGSYTTVEKEITSNGTYRPESGVRWSPVIVNVSGSSGSGSGSSGSGYSIGAASQTFTDNGTYLASDDGLDGWSVISIDVQNSSSDDSYYGGWYTLLGSEQVCIVNYEEVKETLYYYDRYGRLLQYQNTAYTGTPTVRWNAGDMVYLYNKD